MPDWPTASFFNSDAYPSPIAFALANMAHPIALRQFKDEIRRHNGQCCSSLSLPTMDCVCVRVCVRPRSDCLFAVVSFTSYTHQPERGPLIRSSKRLASGTDFRAQFYLAQLSPEKNVLQRNMLQTTATTADDGYKIAAARAPKNKPNKSIILRAHAGEP